MSRKAGARTAAAQSILGRSRILRCCIAGRWGLRRSSRDFEAEDVGARVVAGDVEVEFAFGDFAEVEVGGEDAFTVVAGSGEELAHGADDHAAAADTVGELAGGEDEAAAFERDV